MAEQEVVGERIGGEDQDLDAEVLVEPDALDPQRHGGEHQPAGEHRQGEGRHGAARSHIDQASRMLFLPNSPRARKVTTAISSRYMESIDHSDA